MMWGGFWRLQKHSGKEFADLWPSETNDVLLHQFITDTDCLENAHIYQNHQRGS